jgi:protein SCO1/2
VSRRAVATALAAAGLATAGCGRQAAPHASAHPEGHRGTKVAAYTAPAFALRDQEGRTVSLAAHRGSVVLVTFLYTSCPDVCPLLASNLNTALRLLPGETRMRTVVLAISVDPEHDTPTAVRRFIREHSLTPQFRYLSASRAELKPVWQAYNVLATPRSDEAIDHSAYVAVVDRAGRVRAYLDSTSSPSAIAQEVRLLSS